MNHRTAASILLGLGLLSAALGVAAATAAAGLQGNAYLPLICRPSEPWWVATYETLDGFDMVRPVAGDGFIAVASSGEVYGLTVARVTIAGELLWARQYAGASLANALLPAADGGWYVAGRAYSEEHNSADGAILKLDANGAVQWQKLYGGGDYDEFTGIAALPGGDLLVSGLTSSFDDGDYDGWVLRLSGDGGIVWQKSFGGDLSDILVGITLTSDGFALLGGRTGSFGATSTDGWLLKLAYDGAPIWQKRLGGGDSEFAVALAATGGTYLLTGFTLADPSLYTWAAAVDPAGNVLWHKAFDSPTDDSVHAASADPNGGFILAGASRANPGDDGWLARLDDSGNLLWQRRYAAGQSDYVRSVAPFGGGYILGGSSGVYEFPGWLLYVSGSGEIGGCPPVGEVGLVASELAFDSSPTNATIADTSVAPIPAEVLERTVSAQPTYMCPAAGR